MPADGKWDLTWRLNLILLTCRIWWAPNNASRWQMGFKHRTLVAVMTWLVIRQFRNRGSIPSKDKGFSRLHIVQTSFGAHRASIQRVPWVNRPEREADHPPPYSAEDKNAWNYTSQHPLYVSQGVETNCSIFTLTLYLLTWRIWWAPNNASKWQMGFNLAFRGLTEEWFKTFRSVRIWSYIQNTFCKNIVVFFRLFLQYSLFVNNSTIRRYDPSYWHSR